MGNALLMRSGARVRAATFALYIDVFYVGYQRIFLFLVITSESIQGMQVVRLNVKAGNVASSLDSE